MELNMKTWNWISALYNDDTTLAPKKADTFTLTFDSDDTFSATTDCNQMSGSYTVIGSKISFSSIASTLKYCEGSQESDFSKLLENASSYLFTSEGELILEQKLDSGIAVFK